MVLKPTRPRREAARDEIDVQINGLGKLALSAASKGGTAPEMEALCVGSYWCEKVDEATVDQLTRSRNGRLGRASSIDFRAQRKSRLHG